ncbi:thiamine pyrophosphokinase [Bacillus sp. SA1-12]|uniref:thiamine diphosphokinase n=1 Tax=Bacillus sp. SA1-12 TaxID=1455638 RepID=UPI00062669D8|nr:thiamine diphosphokinase [Bacillus sp. SA1-12]KKI92564.1 thiamine pyrophosphokinase [Bacillus sp. SA1-12]
MKTIALVAGGPKEYLPKLTDYHHQNVTWVGVDKGVLYLKNSGLPIAYAFGDFDSISDREKKELTSSLPNISLYSAEKDKTDTELALDWALQQQHEKILLFGVTGGRIDHLLGNIHLLIKAISCKTNIEIIDRQNHITLFASGTYTIKKHKDLKYVSFIPISHEIKGMTLEGFKYPLKNCHIALGSTLCISNELIDELGTFSFHDGILLMIRSRD